MVGVLAGCADPRVRVEAPELPRPLVQPLPLHVAVFLPPEARTYVFKDKAGTGARFEVGAASAATLDFAFRTGFTEVVELDALPVTQLPGIDAVLALEAIDWSVVYASGKYATLAHYVFALSAPGGDLVGRWATVQRVESAEVAADPGQGFSWNFTRILEAPSVMLLEKVAAAFLREFREEPDVRAWLESRQAYVPAMPEAKTSSRGDGFTAPLQPAPPGIYVTSDTASLAVRRCVIRELRTLLPERPVLTGPVVRQALFPWFSDAPATDVAAARLAGLARYPAAASRLQALGLGTFVMVSGGTVQDSHGGGFCGGGYGGGGCLGLMWGTRDTFIAAELLDLSRPDELSHSEAHRSGTAVVPMLLLPLPFIPATQSSACRELGKALAVRLREPARR